MEYRIVKGVKEYLTQEEIIERNNQDTSEVDNILLKQQKREAILKIASETDQLNLMAAVIEKLAEGNNDPLIENARQVFGGIKEILNNN